MGKVIYVADDGTTVTIRDNVQSVLAKLDKEAI